MNTEPLPPFPVQPPPPPLPPLPAVRESLLRRRRVPLLVGTAALVLVGGGTAWALASSHSSNNPQPAAAPPASTSAPASGPSTGASAGAKSKGHVPMTRGLITKESGSTWTLRTAAGGTTTVTVNDKTSFGTKKAPAQRSQFTVGHAVVVVGAVQDDSVTAKRIRAAKTAGASSPASPAPTK